MSRSSTTPTTWRKFAGNWATARQRRSADLERHEHEGAAAGVSLTKFHGVAALLARERRLSRPVYDARRD